MSASFHQHGIKRRRLSPTEAVGIHQSEESDAEDVLIEKDIRKREEEDVRGSGIQTAMDGGLGAARDAGSGKSVIFVPHPPKDEGPLIYLQEPIIDPLNRVAHEAMERVVAAVLHCKGITDLPREGVRLATYAVLNFLHLLGRESKKQAEISLRSKANVFDVTKALIKIQPRLS